MKGGFLLVLLVFGALMLMWFIASGIRHWWHGIMIERDAEAMRRHINHLIETRCDCPSCRRNAEL